MESGTALATFLSNIGEVTTNVTGMFGDVLSLFCSEPILLIPTAIFIVGAVIGLVKRLIG